ncbi:hypothetical protein PAF17_19685, partial [Paracoccus sp. Z330]
DVLQSEAQACEKRDAVARRVRTAAETETRRRLGNAGLFKAPQKGTLVNVVAQGAALEAVTAAHPLDAVVGKIAKTTQPPEKRTDGLPVGSQAKFIEAAKCAAILGFPINTLLTVRWSSLYYHDNATSIFTKAPVERIAYLVELLRKWVGARCRGGFQYLWVREVTSDLGEHWHLAFHLPHGKRKAIASYLSDLLGEPLDHTPRTKAQGRTEGEFACSIWGSWHLAKDTRPEQLGFYLAAYLGKGEPSECMFRGKLVPNTCKPVRGRAFGGRERSGRYDAPQGQIRGTAALKKRFDMARPLKQAVKAAQSGDLSGVRV